MARVEVQGIPPFEVPDDWDKAAVDREIASRRSAAQVPTGGDEPVMSGATGQGDTVPAGTYNPQEADPWGKYIDRSVRGYVRGTGLSAAQLADVGVNATQLLANDVNQFIPGMPLFNIGDAPITQWVDRNAAPLTPGYEGAQRAGEITGPAVLEAILTGGVSLPASGAMTTRQLAAQTLKRIPEALVQNVPRAALRTSRDVVTGIMGGQAGGGMAEMIGGPEWRTAGELLGSVFTPGVASAGARKATANALMTPESQARVARFDEYNRGLPESEQIQPTIGTVGKNAASVIEDVTGKSLFAPAAAETRRNLYKNMERGVQREMEQSRGGTTQGQPITRETIGIEAQDAIRAADDAATTKLQIIQNELEAKIGKEAPTNLTNLTDTLDDIISKPKQHSQDMIDQATELRTRLRENLQKEPPQAKAPFYPPSQPQPSTRVSGRQAGYGAIRQARSDLGSMLTRLGQGFKKGLRKQAYRDITRDMEEAAAMQGVTPEEWAAAQTESARLSGQKDILETQAPKPGEGEASTYQKTIGKAGGGSVQHLGPLLEHTPDQTLKMIADDLELRIRKGEAGLKEMDPGEFDAGALQHWRTLSPGRKAELAKKNPDVIEKMDALADIATYEKTRAGQRTRPGKGGSTLGSTMGMGLIPTGGGAGLGAAAYLTNHPALAALSLATGLLGPRIVGEKFTNPAFVRDLAAARNEGLPETLMRAVKKPSVGGAAASAGYEDRYGRARKEGINREMEKFLGRR